MKQLLIVLLVYAISIPFCLWEIPRHGRKNIGYMGLATITVLAPVMAATGLLTEILFQVHEGPCVFNCEETK